MTDKKISAILSRTEGYNRSADSISAEWYLHNFAYYLGFYKDNAEHALLEYKGDPRPVVKYGTGIFEYFGLE